MRRKLPLMKSLSIAVAQVLFLMAVLWQKDAFSEGAFSKSEMLIAHVKASFEKASSGISQLNPQILSLEGMSSSRVRHLLNNLCSLEKAAYLEIGCWKGSTLISALYGNEASLAAAVAIDNWSEFSGPRDEFFHNINKHLRRDKLRIYEMDCFSMSRKAFPYPINIYFYDGNHSEESQRAAFTHFNPMFDDLFIAVVDDWNWEGVRKGTDQAFNELKYKVLFQQELFTSGNDKNSWWNGLYIAVIQK